MEEMQPLIEKLPFRVRVSWAAPQFAVLSVYMLLTIHATIFYDYLGANLAFIAFGTAFSRSWDVVSDPLMGWLSDSTRSRWGRRLPYMIVGMWFYAVSLVLVLGAGVILPDDVTQQSGGTCFGNGTDFDTDSDADQSDSAKVSAWYTVTFVLFYLSDTVCNIPYSALGPEIAPDYDNRSRLYFTQNIFGMTGTLFGAVAPVLAEFAGLTRVRAFFAVGVFYGTYYVLSVSNLAINCKEKTSKDTLSEVIPLVPSVNRAFKNPAFRILVISWLIDAVGWFALAALLPFYLKFVVRPGITPGFDFMDDETWLGAAFASFFIAAILAMPFWKFVERKVGMYKAWISYNVFMGVSNLFFIFVGRGDVVAGMIVTVLNGIPLGGKYLSDATLASCLTVDEFYTGEKREAQFTMFASFVPKVVSIPSNALPLAAIAAAGFIGSKSECVDGIVEVVPQEQTSFVKALIVAFFVGLPVLANAISIMVKLRFPLKSSADHYALSEGIRLHHEGKPAHDPISGTMVPSHKALTPEEARLGVLLDHFSTMEQLRLASNGINASFLIRRSIFRLCFSLLMLGFCISTVVLTFHLLEVQSLSWIPSFAQVCVGLFLMASVFSYMKLRAAVKIRHEPGIDKAFIVKWCQSGFTSAALARRLRNIEDNKGEDSDDSLSTDHHPDTDEVLEGTTSLRRDTLLSSS